MEMKEANKLATTGLIAAIEVAHGWQKGGILTLGSSFWRFEGGGPSASWSRAENEDDG